jgi:hypothetical protein
MTSPLRNIIIQFLRDPKNLFVYFNQEGFIIEDILKQCLSIHNEDIENVLTSCGRNVERVLLNNINIIRATFGHSGHLLFQMNYGKFVPYSGPYDTFCISHTTLSGLGMLSQNRKVNVLTIPERCENKGAKGFVKVDCGLLFWSQVGDRYNNKVFCFDPHLNEHFYRIDYVSDYISTDRIKKYHSTGIDCLKKMNNFSEEKAIEHMKKLFITEDDLV